MQEKIEQMIEAIMKIFEFPCADEIRCDETPEAKIYWFYIDEGKRVELKIEK